MENQINEIKVVYSSDKTDVKITQSSDAYYYLKQFYSECMEHREQAVMLLLNRANKVIGHYLLGVGGVAGCVVDRQIAFQVALKCNASGIILSHNHPSGNLKPSKSDEKLTATFAEAGKIIGIGVLDHLILTKESYYSFADEGMI